MIGLVGPSGCGKSTLLELVCGLRQPSDGTIEVDGGSAAGSGWRLRLHAAERPASALALGGRQRGPGAAQPRRAAGRRRARRAAPLLRRASAWRDSRTRGPASSPEGCASASPSCARSSPTSRCSSSTSRSAGLDAITRAEMQEWLAGALESDPRTTILVTHDVEEALYLCDRVAVLAPRPTKVVAELAAPRPRLRSRTRSSPRPVRRGPRAGHVGRSRGLAMRRWLAPPALLVVGPARRLAGRGAIGVLSSALNLRAVPRPARRTRSRPRSGRTVRCSPTMPG